MTDGTYLGPQPVAEVPDLAGPLRDVLAQWDDVRTWISGLPGITRVFLVGAGGSYLNVQAAQYVLDTGARVPAAAVNSDEFYFRAPPSVGPGALVLLLSGAGETPETVRAAEWAASRGAAVACVTLKATSPVAHAAGKVFAGGSGDANQVLLQFVALALLEREGRDVGAELAALRALPAALETGVRAFEERAAEVVSVMKDVPVTHVIASGPLFGPASVLTSCYLQEMQWMNAMTINADEFFQGPFEVIDDTTRTIVFLGEDATRPMGERVRTFLDKYSGPTCYLDTRNLEMPGIAPGQRAFVSPLVVSALVARLAAHYAAQRGYALAGRRYMWTVDYAITG
ncbi:SIS domain-containing protein [Kineococcus esterisolvens]|uniref:SIS domain-containing protein n=1 Tax=unclassified Kineococcus TaxID=2621656 RepID=UPI003D7DCC5F